MVLRLCFDKMALYRLEHMLALRQRQPDQPWCIFSYRRTTADFMNGGGPIRSDQFQHDPPLHPALPATTIGRSHSTPQVLDGLRLDGYL
jgi:hypothetical protein